MTDLSILSPRPTFSRRAFLERLTVVFGAITLAPGLEVLETSPVGYTDFSYINASFEVLRGLGWVKLGTLTKLEPPELRGMQRIDVFGENDENMHIGRLEQGAIRMMIDDVPLNLHVLGSVWFGHVNDWPAAPTDGRALYRFVFDDGTAYYSPARTER